MDAIIRVHSEDHVRELLDSIPDIGFVRLDSDTMASPGSGEAALRAAGAVVLAIDMVMAGEVDNAFCAVRPPGHHATRMTPWAFACSTTWRSARFTRGPFMG